MSSGSHAPACRRYRAVAARSEATVCPAGLGPGPRLPEPGAVPRHWHPCPPRTSPHPPAGTLAATVLAAGLACAAERTTPRPPRPFASRPSKYEDELTREGKRGERRMSTASSSSSSRCSTSHRRRSVRTCRPSSTCSAKFVPTLRSRRTERFKARGEEIVANVNRYASNGCGFFKRDPSSGIQPRPRYADLPPTESLLRRFERCSPSSTNSTVGTRRPPGSHRRRGR